MKGGGQKERETTGCSIEGVVMCIYHNILYVLSSHRTLIIKHTGKCICRFGGIHAYCRYFVDRKW